MMSHADAHPHVPDTRCEHTQDIEPTFLVGRTRRKSPANLRVSDRDPSETTSRNVCALRGPRNPAFQPLERPCHRQTAKQRGTLGLTEILGDP